MHHKFYRLPFKFDAVFDETSDEIPVCSERESIDQNLELILTTCPGEHKFDKNFGCRIWDMDFERVVSRSKWEERFAGHITYAVRTFETRLKNIEVKLDIQDVIRENVALKTTAIKKQVMVHIKGNLVSNDEPCGFYYTLFLGPLTTKG